MSRLNGQLVTCDRCGKTTFRKHIGDGETDGGFTRWNKFEDMPKSWGTHKSNDLCPECFSVWKDLEREFMKKETAFLNECLNNRRNEEDAQCNI